MSFRSDTETAACTASGDARTSSRGSPELVIISPRVCGGSKIVSAAAPAGSGNAVSDSAGGGEMSVGEGRSGGEDVDAASGGDSVAGVERSGARGGSRDGASVDTESVVAPSGNRFRHEKCRIDCRGMCINLG